MLSKKNFSAITLSLLVGIMLIQPSSTLFQARIDQAYAAATIKQNHTVILTAPNGDTTALENSLNNLKRNYTVTSVKRLSRDTSSVIVTFSPTEDVVMVMAAASSSSVRIEPDYILQATTAPTDAQYAEQWALHNTAQTYHTSATSTTHGTSGIDINWQPVFERSSYRGAPITVAVIDSGVTATHPDLADKMWINTAETSDHLDNDHNGMIDDVHGWNFIDSNDNVADTHGHGTQVAGIIAARNDTAGLVGIAPAAKIMPLRVLGSDGSGTTSDVIQAINYAVANGAKVINMSLGAPFADSEALITACNNAVAHGVVVVAAAGNSNVDIATYHFAPAVIPSVIAVGSISNTGAKASFSNTGNALAVVTPGIQIVSTRAGTTGSSSQVLPDGSNSYMISSGTSFSSPMVAAAAALVLEKNPSFSVAQVRSQLQSTARDLGTPGKDTSFGYGLLDLGRALGITGVTPLTTNRAPKITSATWSPSSFNNENNENISLTVNASDPDSDSLTVTANLSAIGLSTQTLSYVSGTTYQLTGITPTVGSGTYTIPVLVSDASRTVNKDIKLRVTITPAAITIAKPSTRTTYTTNKSSVVISGTARGPIRQIKINGETLSSFVYTQHRWTQTISLPIGTSTYTIVGYSGTDEALATKTISITRT